MAKGLNLSTRTGAILLDQRTDVRVVLLTGDEYAALSKELVESAKRWSHLTG